jgi:hypothetical protein
LAQQDPQISRSQAMLVLVLVLVLGWCSII